MAQLSSILIDENEEVEQLLLIKKDPMYIKYMENPSIKVQCAATYYDPYYIKYIKNPDANLKQRLKNSWYGTSTFPLNLIFEENLTYDDQLAAITRDFKSARYIKNIDPDILALAILMGYLYIELFH